MAYRNNSMVETLDSDEDCVICEYPTEVIVISDSDEDVSIVPECERPIGRITNHDKDASVVPEPLCNSSEDSDLDDCISSISESFRSIVSVSDDESCLVPANSIVPLEKVPVPPKVIAYLESCLMKIKDRLIRRLEPLQMENKYVEVAAWQNFIDGVSLVNFESLLVGWSSTRYMFFLKSMRGTLPDPRNLAIWNNVGDGQCRLCNEKSSGFVHVLSSCQTSLIEGRYSYRHDAVLGIIRESISFALAISARDHRSSSEESALLKKSNDWLLMMDKKNENYVFPKELFNTNLRPDILVYSMNLKRVILVELSVPWENYVAPQHLKKTMKYKHLIEGIKKNNFTVDFFALEVSIKGIPTKLMFDFLKLIGLNDKLATVYLNKICNKAVEASHLIWIYRSSKWILDSNKLIPYTAHQSESNSN